MTVSGQLPQQQASMPPHKLVRIIEAFQQLFLRWRFRERKLRDTECGSQWTTNRISGRLDSFRRVREFRPILHGLLKGSARLWVSICAASHHKEGERAWIATLQCRLRVSGVITIKAAVLCADSRVVTGVAEDQRQRFALESTTFRKGIS